MTSPFKQNTYEEHDESTGPNYRAWADCKGRRERHATVLIKVMHVINMLRDDWNKIVVQEGLADVVRNGVHGSEDAMALVKVHKDAKYAIKRLVKSILEEPDVG